MADHSPWMWGHHGLLISPHSLTGHLSRPSTPKSSSQPQRKLSKIKSNPDLSNMAAVASPFRFNEQLEPPETFNTIPDPRSPDAHSIASRKSSISPRHPDLSNEVAALSDKLIIAINHQTALDDNLAATRQELENARRQIRRLEQAEREHTDLIARGQLLWKKNVDDERSRLNSEILREREQRLVMEKDKKKMEQELEMLTAALFEEANEMVAQERKERDKVDRKNEQLKSQIKDMESLLSSHQEQLSELKNVMQQMSKEREDMEKIANSTPAPSTPAFAAQDKDNMSRFLDVLNLSPNTPGELDVPPAPPLFFTHLLHPSFRTDTQAFEDFASLLELSRTSAPPSRVSSGSYTGLNVISLATFASHSVTSLHTPAPSIIQPRSTPNSPMAGNNTRDLSPSIALKETSFYKRILVEDVEPTLRLELAPGISWLARRSVMSAVYEGNLVVEPMPLQLAKFSFSCGLCGERRKGAKYERTHRIKMSESESATRYPLCPYCLNRVRTTCDFMSFLRMIREGHWRTSGVGGDEAAWEESVRLRECMFWARMGGGVIPAFLPGCGPSTTDDEMQTVHSDMDLSRTSSLSASTSDGFVVAKRGSEDPFRVKNVVFEQERIGQRCASVCTQTSEPEMSIYDRQAPILPGGTMREVSATLEPQIPLQELALLPQTPVQNLVQPPGLPPRNSMPISLNPPRLSDEYARSLNSDTRSLKSERSLSLMIPGSFQV